ncbi:MAG TPA: hypothetical protein VMX16_08095 [Terriglobia bacterium]|nr:hypothetical protein [Terriglobia bacterium]
MRCEFHRLGTNLGLGKLVKIVNFEFSDWVRDEKRKRATISEDFC